MKYSQLARFLFSLATAICIEVDFNMEELQLVIEIIGGFRGGAHMGENSFIFMQFLSNNWSIR